MMSPPELVIGRRLLGLVGSALLVALLLSIGHLASPRVDGRPVLLSPANWRLTRYLDDAQAWFDILDQEHAALVSMVPIAESAADGELPRPLMPAGASTVYERSRALERSLSRLGQVGRALEQTDAPPALESLHALVMVTADELLTLHAAVATVLGSPSSGAQERAWAQAQTAADHLLALERALQAQMALIGTATTAAAPVAAPGSNVDLSLMGDGQAAPLGR